MHFFGLSAVMSIALVAPVCLAQDVATSLFASPTQTDSEASPTVTLRPSSTGEPCAAIASAVSNSESSTVAVDAEIAYACLQSVPINQQAANMTIDAVIRMVEFQSTLSFLKNPPDGYANDPVDLIAGLNDIWKKVLDGDYSKEYDFEGDISNLLDKAYDGHLGFEGYAWSGAFTWRRSRAITLGLASTDGNTPKVYCIRDFNTSGSFTPSAVSQINGQDVMTFMEDLSAKRLYHDADARWNSLSLMQAAESGGGFIGPPDYPGPNTTLTFENGTTSTFLNTAIVNDVNNWSGVSNGQQFYNAMVRVSSSSNNNRKRQINQPLMPDRILPPKLRMQKTLALERNGTVPAGYPEPFLEHSNPDVPFGGFFIDNHPSVPNLAVLVIQTFSTTDTADTQEWQMLLQNFLAEAKTRNTEKIIIDVRDNGGGKIFLGYETFKQFFPEIVPFGGNRYRANNASDILGNEISQLPFSVTTSLAYSSSWNYRMYLDDQLDDFADWDAMFGPVKVNGDQFTNLLRYNLSNPLLTSDPNFGLGITITGYDDRSNFTESPFNASDIIILSDGVCASTCGLFVEMMKFQAGVRTFTVGGRPQAGPMQAVGGTKGAEVLTGSYLSYISNYVFNSFASTRAEQAAWDAILPFDFAINVNYAGINFMDNIRQGQVDAGVPTQFANDTSSCRLWYTPEMYLNVTELWSAVADTVWGSGDGIDESKCVSGSFTNNEVATLTDNTANTGGSTSSSTGQPTSTSTKNAAARGVGGVQPFNNMIVGVATTVFVSFILGMGLI